MTHILQNEEAASALVGGTSLTFNHSMCSISSALKMLPPDHLISKWRDQSALYTNKDMVDLKKAVWNYNRFAPYINRRQYAPTNSLKDTHDLVLITYPLLTLFSKHQQIVDNSFSHMYEMVVNYVNMVDAKIELQSEI